MSKKERLKALEPFMGKIALRYHLFSDNAGSGATNAAIIQTIAIKGPLWLFEICKETQKTGAQWKSLFDVPTTQTSYCDRLKDLVKRGFLFRTERERDPDEPYPGLDSYNYELTYRGAIAAVTLPGVRKYLPEFISWKRTGGLLRLPGLENIGKFIEQNTAVGYWNHFILEVAEETLLHSDINETSDEKLYHIWVTALMNHFAKISAQTRSKQGFAELKSNGWTEEAVRNYESAMRNNAQFREKLKENARAAREAAQAFQEAFQDLESTTTS
jgi:hypothetical protein